MQLGIDGRVQTHISYPNIQHRRPAVSHAQAALVSERFMMEGLGALVYCKQDNTCVAE